MKEIRILSHSQQLAKLIPLGKRPLGDDEGRLKLRLKKIGL